MCHQFRRRRITQRGQAQQAALIPQRRCQFRLQYGLSRLAADSRNSNRCRPPHLRRCQLQDRPIQPNFRLPNRELRRMHAHRQTARPGCQVIAG